MIVNIFTVIAVIIPIYYFFKILSSQKITATEEIPVFAYIPLFIAGVLFWSIEEQGSVVLALFADDQTRLYFLMYLGIRFISHLAFSKVSIPFSLWFMCRFLRGCGENG